MMLNEKGHEVLDTTPLALPVGWKLPMTLQEQIRMYIRRELSEVAADQGRETFEDADDFDVGDEEELKSEYELDSESESLGRWREDDQRRSAIEAAERRIISTGVGDVGAASARSVEPNGGSAPEGGVSSSDNGGASGRAYASDPSDVGRAAGVADPGGRGVDSGRRGGSPRGRGGQTPGRPG